MSLIAAVLLTGVKLAVGLWTNSLGILAEAAHSALDFVAAAATYWAVSVSSRPADDEHTYGHGKVENLSALFETVLLLATCAWIVWEGVERLLAPEAIHVQANLAAFLTVLLSIVVDVGRSRALSRAARKHRSQALEADALHFSTDIASSAVVLLGLVGLRIADATGAEWLRQADAVAALAVAGIVIVVSLRLGRRSIDGLLDAVPSDLRERVAAAAQAVPGVLAVPQVRVRTSGPEHFAEVTVTVDRALGVEGAHEVADRAEAALHALLPASDVLVHVEPTATEDEDLLTTVRVLAARRGLGAHAIRIHDSARGRELALHLEVDAALRLDAAHALASAFEADLHAAFPDLDRITTHIEPFGADTATRHVQPADDLRVRHAVDDAVARLGVDFRPRGLRIQRVGDELSLLLDGALDPATSIVAAHDATERLEKALRARLPDLGRVVIHVEPEE